MSGRKANRHKDSDKTRPRGTETRVRGKISPRAAPARGGETLLKFGLPVLLFVLGFVVFLRVLANDFINYDDYDYVTGNFQVQKGLAWEGVKWAFSSFYASNWHPLTWLSHMLDCQLYGLQPWGHHLTSLLLHAPNTCLVFCVLRKMTGAVWKSAFVAALFGVHPLHVESVAWVAERKDVLSTAFWLASLWAYAQFTTENGQAPARRRIFYLLSLAFLGLGLLSKQMLVTAPCLLLLLDYWPLNRWGKIRARTLLLEKLPFFLICAVAGVFASLAERTNMNLDAVDPLPVTDRLENALVSYATYLGKLFFPVNLAVIYPYQIHLPLTTVVLAGLVLLAITVGVVKLRLRQPWLPVGWFWFMGTLVPVIGLVQIGSQALDDRYTYVPSIGLFLMIGWGAAALTQGWRPQRAVLAWSAAVIILLCAGLAWRQIGYWKNSETLFRHTLAVTKDNFIAYANLGSYELNRRNLDSAVELCEAAVKIKPTWIKARIDLGLALEDQGHLDEALDQYQQVVKLAPDNARGHFNVGMILKEKGQFDEAITQLQAGLKLEPDVSQAHDELGALLAGQNHLADAILQFQEAVRLAPGNAAAKKDLALALKTRDSLVPH